MIERVLKEKIIYFAKKFPVVTLTGARQCGKSTLLKNCFPDYRYVSLEDIDVRYIAQNDPRGFLSKYDDKTIIDEAQIVPELFSYIQTKVDSANKEGMYILSGSHNFLLMQSITQSLAGRTAVMKLFPFSWRELQNTEHADDSINQLIFTGGYPRIYDKKIHPDEFFPSYIQTYIERDVRLIKNINDVSVFIRFLKLCAGRTGQLLNILSIANECGISHTSAQSWLSILETSNIIYLLKPYYKNFNKRLIKSAKLYFYDTGLVCSLLGIELHKQLISHYYRGELFENWIISEYFKNNFTGTKEPNIYFWRDSNGNEVDLVIENGNDLKAVEIKSGSTFKPDFLKGLKNWQKISGISSQNTSLVYGGDEDLILNDINIFSWKTWCRNANIEI